MVPKSYAKELDLIAEFERRNPLLTHIHSDKELDEFRSTDAYARSIMWDMAREIAMLRTLLNEVPPALDSVGHSPRVCAAHGVDDCRACSWLRRAGEVFRAEPVAYLHEDTPFPEEVLLTGCAYRISEHEGLIVFSEARPMYGMGTRFSFFRNSAGSWEVRIDSCIGGPAEGATCGPDTIDHAFDVVQRHRGDTFGRPYPLPPGWDDKAWAKLSGESKKDHG